MAAFDEAFSRSSNTTWGNDHHMNELVIITLGVGALGMALIVVLGATFFTVEQRTIAIVQRLGRYFHAEALDGAGIIT